MFGLGMRLTVTTKANHSWQKQITHGKNKFTHGKSKSTQNAYSGGQSVLEVLLLFTAGHRYHSQCFPLTLASRVAANMVNVKANTHTSSG